MTEFLIVDTSSLSIIYTASKEAGLDALKSYGKQIIVTKSCYEELRNFPGSQDVRAWVDRNAIIPSYTDTALRDAERDFRLGLISEEARDRVRDQAGDREIKALASGKMLNGNSIDFSRDNVEAKNALAAFAPSGAEFRLLTDDGGFYRNIIQSVGKTPQKYVDLGMVGEPFNGAKHFFANQKATEQISDNIYNAWVSGYKGTPNYLGLDKAAKDAADAYLANPYELNNRIPGLLQKLGINNLDFIPSAFFTGMLGVAFFKGVPVVADMFGFYVTAAQAAEYLEEGKDKDATELWVKYIFETMGGVAGAASGAIAATYLTKGAGTFWPPLIGGVIGGVLGGGFGAAAGELVYQTVPEIFDGIFDPIYEEIRALYASSEMSFDEAFITVMRKKLGFDFETVEGGDAEDWLLASGVESRLGKEGDDFLLAIDSAEIKKGARLDPANPDSKTAPKDLRPTLDGGAGNDWVIAIGGEKAITIGGNGRDWIFNTSKGGKIYGDTIDGRSPDGTDLEGKENSDSFWWWSDVGTRDAKPKDVLKFFDVPLTGGSQTIPVIGVNGGQLMP
jgi:hypothetical protein